MCVRRADAGANFAGRIVDDDNRPGQLRPEPRDALFRQCLELRLKPRVDGKLDDFGLAVGGDRLLGGVRGERRERQARLRDRLALRRCGVGGADEAARGDAVEHAVARRARDLRRTIRPARFGRLRQRDQKRRLRDGQPQRLLAEIGERGRAHALEIAAKGSEREITVERSWLADVALDLERARDLPEFGGDRALGPRLDQPRDLHRQGRAAGHHMAARQPLRAGANERAKIDAVVLVKPAVLIGDEHRDVARIDVMRGRRQPPASVGQSERPEQPAVAIDDDRRAFARRGKIERAEACHVARPGGGRAKACRCYEG